MVKGHQFADHHHRGVGDLEVIERWVLESLHFSDHVVSEIPHHPTVQRRKSFEVRGRGPLDQHPQGLEDAEFTGEVGQQSLA